MTNILFINYHDFTSNSAIQIHTFANHLVKSGHDCIVAVPSRKDTVYQAIRGDVLYSPREFSELLTAGTLFLNKRGPDIIHAWTPREIVREVCVRLLDRYACKLIVHLEDNEEQILMNRLQRTMQELYSCSEEELSTMIPGNLSHPHFYREFLSKADGITLIIERLAEFVPESIPNMVLWPGIDRARFRPGQCDTNLRYALGLDEDVVVLCYTGNVHYSNREEVRSLYCAVALLNLEGIPTRLLRTGVDHVQFLGDDLAWAQEYSIEIGFVPHDMIPQLLSVADILVQPGRADEYNAYRLPSKLPEFFWMRKPVILPKVNIGLLVTDGREALLLHEGGAREIVEKVRMILTDPQLAEELSYHAGIFAEQSFDAEKNTEKLESFYRAVLNGA